MGLKPICLDLWNKCSPNRVLYWVGFYLTINKKLKGQIPFSLNNLLDQFYPLEIVLRGRREEEDDLVFGLCNCACCEITEPTPFVIMASIRTYSNLT